MKPLNMKPMSKYEEYILSYEWRQKANQRLEIDKNRCVMCGCRGTMLNPLQVHHLTYHNIYNEDVDKDLVTVCKSCHLNVHSMMNRITNSTTGQRGWKDTLTPSVHVSNISEDRRREWKFGEEGKDESEES